MQTIAGKLRLHVGGQAVELAAGQMLVLEPGVRHDVETDTESAFLLTIAA
jgi:quercetin dioxygenase-like cupin family protein